MEKFRPAKTNKDIDLVGIGNAIVDIVANVDEKFLVNKQLKKNSMNLIGLEQSKELLKDCQVIKKVSGGSSANTVVSLSKLGNKVEFIGRVKDDNFGDYFSNDIKNNGVTFNTKALKTSASSAHSIILVTPDAQRTMCTYLGASIEFKENDINYESIRKSKYLYLEGYLWDSELAKDAFIKASKAAKESGTKIILSLSDSFCVNRHRESFISLIKNYIDILFCNEEEFKSLLEEKDFNTCKKHFNSLCNLIIITMGDKGSLIIHEKNIQTIKPIILGKVIDTTGAGDLYAGGFIHGLINDYSLDLCGKLGSICAGHIITQIGSRSHLNLNRLINKILN